MALSTWVRQQLLNYIWGNQTYTPSASFSAQLWTAGGVEADYAGYSAVSVTRNTTNFSAASTDGSNITSISTSSDIEFAGPTSIMGSESDITEFRLYDGSNLVFTKAFSEPIEVSLDDAIVVNFTASSTPNSNASLSTSFMRSVFNYLFRAEAITIPSTYYFDLYSTPPSISGAGGTLTDYGSYAQVGVANNTTNFGAAQISGDDVSSSQATVVNFPTATSSASLNVSGVAIWGDSARTTLIARGSLVTSKPIQSGNSVRIPANLTHCVFET